MRVATYYPWIYLMSGVERTIVEVCRRSRHEHTIFTNHYSAIDTYPAARQLSIVQTAKVPVRRNMGAVLRAAATIASQKLDLRNFDLLTVHCDGLGDLALLRNPNIPAVCFCHTPLRPVFDEEYRTRALSKRGTLGKLGLRASSAGFRALDRWLWPRYRHVFFNSCETRNRALAGGLLHSLTPSYEVLHPGIDWQSYSPTGFYGDYFLAAGRIMWTKNLELAIRAFQHFTESYRGPKRFRLIIAGQVDHKSKPYLQALRSLANGRQDIEFAVSPSDDQLRNLLDRCYALLFPPFNEDWGMVPLEANAMAKPVIAANRGGPTESIIHGKTGLLVEPSPEHFSAAMTLLANDANLVKRMGAFARQSCRQYDWSGFVQRIDDVSEEIVGTVAETKHAVAA